MQSKVENFEPQRSTKLLLNTVTKEATAINSPFEYAIDIKDSIWNLDSRKRERERELPVYLLIASIGEHPMESIQWRASNGASNEERPFSIDRRAFQRFLQSAAHLQLTYRTIHQSTACVYKSSADLWPDCTVDSQCENSVREASVMRSHSELFSVRCSQLDEGTQWEPPEIKPEELEKEHRREKSRRMIRANLETIKGNLEKMI